MDYADQFCIQEWWNVTIWHEIIFVNTIHSGFTVSFIKSKPDGSNLSVTDNKSSSNSEFEPTVLKYFYVY